MLFWMAWTPLAVADDDCASSARNRLLTHATDPVETLEDIESRCGRLASDILATWSTELTRPADCLVAYESRDLDAMKRCLARDRQSEALLNLANDRADSHATAKWTGVREELRERIYNAARQIDVVEAPPPALETIDKRVPDDPVRTRHLEAYLRQHCPDASPSRKPWLVVLHGTSDRSVDAALARFEPPSLPPGDPRRRGGELNVGAHWLVDRDGTIFQLAPEEQVVRHTIGLNHAAIAIENLGDGPEHPLTPAQVTANRALIRDIRTRWNIRGVLGHYQANGRDDLCETDPDYWGLPLDPGPAFVAGVRGESED